MNDLRTTREVAERLGVDVSTVARMVADGRIECAWQGPGATGPRLFTDAAIEAAKAHVEPRPKRRPEAAA